MTVLPVKVTVCVARILILSFGVGTPTGSQVVGSFQFPVFTETLFTPGGRVTVRTWVKLLLVLPQASEKVHVRVRV